MMRVKIKNIGIGDWDNRVGEVVGVAKVGGKNEFIVQFKKPTEWSYFTEDEFDEVKAGDGK